MNSKHWHHIIPKHTGGTDDPSNLVELTIEEHALAHKKLWEEHGRWQDRIAWQHLSRMITQGEAYKQAAILAKKGKKLTLEHRAKLSAARTGKTPSEETKKKISQSHIGIKPTKQHREKLSLAKQRPRKPLSEAHRQNLKLAWQKRKGLTA